MDDLKFRIDGRMQLTTDGHGAYLNAVADTFGDTDIDYAMLVKLYGEEKGRGPEKRYSPAICTGAKKKTIAGDPDFRHVSTSHVERQNLSMRMHMRGFTRLTNAFSKKLDSHIHALSLYFVFYNFARVHKTLRMSPAMAAGVADRLWGMEDIAALIDANEVPAKKRGPYQKRSPKRTQSRVDNYKARNPRRPFPTGESHAFSTEPNRSFIGICRYNVRRERHVRSKKDEKNGKVRYSIDEFHVTESGNFGQKNPQRNEYARVCRNRDYYLLRLGSRLLQRGSPNFQRSRGLSRSNTGP